MAFLIASLRVVRTCDVVGVRVPGDSGLADAEWRVRAVARAIAKLVARINRQAVAAVCNHCNVSPCGARRSKVKGRLTITIGIARLVARATKSLAHCRQVLPLR
jgi:hypothetical protein